MAYSPALTWPIITDDGYLPDFQPTLAPLARAYYLQQGRLLTAASYLFLPAATAAEPFTDNPAAAAMIRAILPSADEIANAALYDDTLREVLASLGAVLQKRGLALVDLMHGLKMVESGEIHVDNSLASLSKLVAAQQLLRELEAQGAGRDELHTAAIDVLTTTLALQGDKDYVAGLLGADFWVPVVAAWQQHVQRRLDDEGRLAQLLNAQAANPDLQNVIGTLYNRLLSTHPTASLESLAALPSNELARSIWPTEGGEAIELFVALLNPLRQTAQWVLNQNYLDADVLPRLLETVAPELVPFAQALLAPTVGAPLASIGELANADLPELAARLRSLPANHPLAYALATCFQTVVQHFLQSLAPAAVEARPTLLTLRGQLLGVENIPLPNFTLQLTQVLSTGTERVIGSVSTDDSGRFAFQAAQGLYLDDNDEVAETAFFVRAAIYAPGQQAAAGPAFTTTMSTSGAGTEQVYHTPLQAPSSVPASSALSSLGLSIPASLSSLLQAKHIASLAAILDAGGLQQLAGDLLATDPAAATAARTLDGLAQFEIMSADIAFNKQVVAAGLTSPTQVARASTRGEFIDQVAGANANDEQRIQAASFYDKAVTVSTLSQTMGLFAQSERSINGTPVLTLADLLGSGPDSTITLPGGATPLPYPLQTGFNAPPAGYAFNYSAEQQCDCPACRSAVSPTAYLAALLNYGAGSTNTGGTSTPVGKLFVSATVRATPGQLQSLLRQPYCDLPVSCQSANELVCQYRLAIEVVQAHWRASGGAALTVGQARAYVEAAADALLQSLGTTLAEVRAASGAALTELATRLQLTEALLTYIQSRLSAAYLIDSQGLDGIEADFEDLFGLVSTARDPLSTGLLLNAATANAGGVQLVRQRFEGVNWGLNTGPDGRLHLDVTPPSGATAGAVTVYALDSANQKHEDKVVARGKLVLSASSATDTYTSVLYQQHGSGLEGSVIVKITGANLATTAFTVRVVPQVTAERQQALRADWLAQDTADVALLQAHGTASWNEFSFLIDPDLLGPDDFRPLVRTAADYGNPAFATWRRRYDFLQNQLVTDLLVTAANPAGTPLGAILNALTQQNITYTSTNGTATARKPWPTTPAVASGTLLLTRLHTQLAGNGTAVQAATATLASLGLNTEAMQRLYDLWQLSTSTTQPLAAADYQEALDIIRQSVKKAFETAWVQEEVALNLNLTAKLFQSALHEPLAGVWDQPRATAFGLTPSQRPVIDPDEVTPLDLPDANLGDAAIQLWGQRQAELLRKRQALVALGQAVPAAFLATPGTTSQQALQQQANEMLTYAYRPNPLANGGPGPMPYATLEATWSAYLNEADVKHADAVTYITENLALRPAEAERLLNLRAQVLTQATDALWQEMAALLTLGWKRTVAYHQTYVPEGQDPYIGVGQLALRHSHRCMPARG